MSQPEKFVIDIYRDGYGRRINSIEISGPDHDIDLHVWDGYGESPAPVCVRNGRTVHVFNDYANRAVVEGWRYWLSRPVFWVSEGAYRLGRLICAPPQRVPIYEDVTYPEDNS